MVKLYFLGTTPAGYSDGSFQNWVPNHRPPNPAILAIGTPQYGLRSLKRPHTVANKRSESDLQDSESTAELPNSLKDMVSCQNCDPCRALIAVGPRAFRVSKNAILLKTPSRACSFFMPRNGANAMPPSRPMAL